MRAWHRTAAALGLAALGCGGGGEEPKTGTGGTAGTGGTDAGPVVLDVYPGDFVEEDQPMNMLKEGDFVQLVAAPQGGHVSHPGAQVRGLTNDIANMRAEIVDIATGAIKTYEARDVVMKPVPGQPDLMQNDLRSVSQVTHIPVCPNYDPVASFVDTDWNLRLTVTEVDGPGQGVATLKIKLGCLQTDPSDKAQCECECEPDYVLGKCAGGFADAGTD